LLLTTAFPSPSTPLHLLHPFLLPLFVVTTMVAVDPCQDGNNGGCSDFCDYKGPGIRTCSCNANARFVAGSGDTICECLPGYSLDPISRSCQGTRIFFFDFFLPEFF
jgi:hypothetical protein